MSHVYEVSTPKVALARAKNKCRACGRAILKGEKYLMYWYLDTCSHRLPQTRYRTVGFHRQMKLCYECMGQVLEPKMADGQVRLRSNYLVKTKKILREIIGVSRYDIATGKDPVDRFISNVNVKKKAITGEKSNFGG